MFKNIMSRFFYGSVCMRYKAHDRHWAVFNVILWCYQQPICDFTSVCNCDI